MKIHSFLKYTANNDDMTMEDRFVDFVTKFNITKIKIVSCVFVMCIIVSSGFYMRSLIKNISFSDETGLQFADIPIAATTNKKSTITIPCGTVKANPFLPYRKIEKGSDLDVPDFTLPEPPTEVNENSDAARVMDTVVSGILYDKYSPSAILNIEGTDYLVKKGDIVNNYKVLNILKDSVTVKLGANTYKAGIGEILTEGIVNKNDVSNLNTKFGGRK